MKPKIKIMLIMPDAKMHKLKIGSHIRSMREAPLSLAMLAALTPQDIDVEYMHIDESIDKVPLDATVDLVGISVLTGTANRAYELASHFRNQEITVVLGGIHTTILPEEACKHADSVVIGMAETAWPSLIRDFVCNQLKDRYYSDNCCNSEIIKLPSPRTELLRRSGYMIPDTVHATRGCSKRCDFCSVPSIWKQFQKRPIPDVVRDIQSTKGKIIAFSDVNFTDDIEYSKELLTAMIPLKKKWGGLATTNIIDDLELVQLMAESGCIYILTGFESINQSSLCQIAKGFNQTDRYKELVSLLHHHNISIQGCFVFGFDQDDKNVFQSTVQQVQELKIDIPRYSIYTPYPGTRLFSRLESEHRILSYNWDDYDTMHVVYQPQNMSPHELYEGFKWAYKETFKINHILKRMSSLSMQSIVNLVGNIAYTLFVKRLYGEERFSRPYSITPKMNYDMKTA